MLHGLLLFLLRKLFPLRYSPVQMAVPLEELKRYRKHTMLTVVLFFLLAPACIVGCFFVLQGCISTYVPAIAGPVVAVRAGTGVYAASSFFPGLAVACCAVALISRLKLGRDGAREYRMLSNRRVGIDATKVFISLGVLTVGGSLAIAYCALHSGLFLGRDELVLRRMWSLHEEKYRYGQITALREVSNGERDEPYFVINFAGAPEWSTEQEVAHPDEEQKRFLARRAGRKIERVVAER